jgi:hypothetical protein
LSGPLGGSGGDFNLFGPPANVAAPTGEWWFTLLANGGSASCMVLSSLGPRSAPAQAAVPTLSEWALVALFALLSGGAALALRRRGFKAFR